MMNSNFAVGSNLKSNNGIRVRPKVNWLRIGIHVLGLYPLAELVFLYFSDQLTVNPIQFVEQFLGRAALNLLLVTLSITPIITVTGWKQPGKHRRALGLYSFLYFALHFVTFAGIDYGLDFKEIIRLTAEKPFIFVGAFAGLILLILSITSFKFWMKRLGKNWKRLHKFVYLVGGLVILHYAWAIKGSLTTMSGDIIRPLLMGSLLSLLMFLRIPLIRKRIIALRMKKRNGPENL